MRTSGFAIASLVLGCLSLISFGLLFPLGMLALVLGVIALVKMGNSRGQLGPHGMAIGGMATEGLSLLMLPLLAAILFPVFAKAREKARQTSCMSNLKMISLATLQYAQQHNETLPPADWRPALEPYLPSSALLVCPADMDGPPSYAYNPHLANRPLKSISDPAAAVMFFDSDDGTNPAHRHNEGSNFAYVDGHVKWRSASSIGTE